MNNTYPPSPRTPGTREPFRFRTDWYHLVVKKVVVRPTPRPRKDGRDLRIVFEAYRPNLGGQLVRCPEERIAQHVGVVFTGEVWRPPDRDDVELLEALGVQGGSLPDDAAADRLIGRWILGLPGPPGRDGFNPLENYQPARGVLTNDPPPGPLVTADKFDIIAPPRRRDAAHPVPSR
jgi:hypothetical protein